MAKAYVRLDPEVLHDLIENIPTHELVGQINALEEKAEQEQLNGNADQADYNYLVADVARQVMAERGSEMLPR